MQERYLLLFAHQVPGRKAPPKFLILLIHIVVRPRTRRIKKRDKKDEKAASHSLHVGSAGETQEGIPGKQQAKGQTNPLALQLMAQGLYNHSTIPIREEDEDKLLPPIATTTFTNNTSNTNTTIAATTTNQTNTANTDINTTISNTTTSTQPLQRNTGGDYSGGFSSAPRRHTAHLLPHTWHHQEILQAWDSCSSPTRVKGDSQRIPEYQKINEIRCLKVRVKNVIVTNLSKPSGVHALFVSYFNMSGEKRLIPQTNKG
ncbi:hypothetical protein O3P69_006871 [Scylla paramamosain]|uniref:Homeobox engrailed C-terminal domain-containing protein n=1 Tax=Scylla paramamosain TaxID=85552 RepID=A0AAW0U1B6_SCYPA